MRYLSVCSGIEAATVAWHPLGWEPAAFAEIESFPSAVLKHHYPSVPNLGDMTKYKEWNIGSIDLLVGGTPCQSFSVAGLRKGLDDPRGNLALVYLGIAERFRPRWILWENVLGVLSSNGGRDFGAFLGALAQLGYGFAYRALDAQYFGVAQRRRRVFVVGYLGDWRRAAAVLFERESLSGNPAPSREKGKGTAGTIKGGSGERGRDVVGPLSANGGTDKKHGFGMGQQDWENGYAIPVTTHSLRSEGFDASEDGTGRGTPLIPTWWDGGQVAQTLDAVLAKGQTMPEKNRFPAVLTPIGFSCKDSGSDALEDTSPTLRSMSHSGSHANAGSMAAVVIPSDTTQITSPANYSAPKEGDPCRPLASGAHVPAVAYSMKTDQTGANGLGVEVVGTLDQANGKAVAFNGDQSEKTHVAPLMQVRRLTPVECARLQGFPDTYLDIVYRGKPAADGPKYKALGNSMAVPVMRWIGQRIQEVDQI